ncbi:MAG: hypothetical protein A2145_02535 [candidate division Zixibacteria bacterium RBG_16_40_9]|nr:MAG: hypothetical protein A2145_02535 [candidate division Zixibacteria bacterium RBG_16_40_9]
MPNEIIHIDFPVEDLEKAKAYYENLFGWKIRVYPEKNLAFFSTGNMPGGAFSNPSSGNPRKVSVCVLVFKLDEILDKATRLGAKIIKPKTFEDNGDEGKGYSTLILNPDGNYLWLWENV